MTHTLTTTEKPTWRDYFALTKPKVNSLLLFTTMTAMVMAARGWPRWDLFLAVFIGGYMSAGASGVFNMIIDRDIDQRMKRTSNRPSASGKISSTSAFIFGCLLTLASFVLLWQAANLLTAMMAMAGLVTYVFIYTLWLKRATWHNIVIGGAAGCFPPLVGWAAVTGDLNLFSWYLFFIIFFWTPVHFWALAIMIKDDYAAVGIPMLPVVYGERMTVAQIGLYAIMTAVLSMIPLLLGEVRWIYFGSALVLNVVLLKRSLELYRNVDRKHSVSLYKYTLLYLALLFLAMAIDRSIL
ncbi:heme o synthase [Deinococcus roseus]|uniref:Protoheme IX farnesyltransferase n=1 Tax=Deinococcus roseus TaxID=392414 RepID=A0ABQ2CTY7_9DEIO|nr:heme o synthase [Deinococcus roseus]GGJ20633.1 protoheme IX farnesyltransferase [Deinococcus roseus]